MNLGSSRAEWDGSAVGPYKFSNTGEREMLISWFNMRRKYSISVEKGGSLYSFCPFDIFFVAGFVLPSQTVLALWSGDIW